MAYSYEQDEAVSLIDNFDQRGFVITVLMTSCLQTECH